ncbi:site-specific DNA-methyltransferase [Algoriphagus sp.]|uniref:site-specific DNA-methyltransferase n=1 Tax=Algoriphagus sp. TaxID=1872435 RepID=UPI0026134BBE|nr:site-specific DNA-methyltransferase [Algoriphagus sp.]
MSIEKLDMKSPDLVNQNFDKLASLFPNCVTESAEGKAIDFDLLKQELSHAVVDGTKERYRLEWPGKKVAIVTANLPTTKTLRPVREDSVDFDTTENIYIEGDNLEVLKLLQESYLGKIKMIYIDPPYNTGKDFVYKDNFSKDRHEEFLESGQKDEYNQRLMANPETAGRYHSDWLTMMYPRLKLARNLLTQNGVTFISIDENENHNLRKVCDEVFGESNFVADIIWQKKTGSSDAKHIATITEYIIVYARNIDLLEFNQDEEAHDNSRYRYKDEHFEQRGPYYTDNLDRGTLGYHETLDYGVTTPDGRKAFPNGRTNQFNDGWRWKWSKSKLDWGIKNDFIELQESPSKQCGWSVYYKIYLNVDNEGNPKKRSSPYKNIIQGILNTHASTEAKELFDRTGIFSNPKPTELINRLLQFSTDENDIILDFFSGSATSAHSVLKVNAIDGLNRKYIHIQLPEKTDESSDAYKAGYKNICEIGKERIRRAAKKIKAEKLEKAQKDGLFADFTDEQDYGFRVYRLDSSNMQDVYYRPQDYQQSQLDAFADNIKPDRTPDDLLTQILLDWGLPLSLKISSVEISGKKVYQVAENSLYACFDSGIDEDFAKEIAKDSPLRVVFRDNGFKNDTAKVNVRQLLKQLSPETEMKVI